MYGSAYTMLMYDIISYARGHECEGCPLKNSGVIKYGSCAFRLSIFYKNNRNIQHFTTFTPPQKLTKLVYTRPELSPLDFLRFGP